MGLMPFAGFLMAGEGKGKSFYERHLGLFK